MGRDEKAQKTVYNQLKRKEQKKFNFSLFWSSVPSPELITQWVLHTHTHTQKNNNKKPLSMKENGNSASTLREGINLYINPGLSQPS